MFVATGMWLFSLFSYSFSLSCCCCCVQVGILRIRITNDTARASTIDGDAPQDFGEYGDEEVKMLRAVEHLLLHESVTGKHATRHSYTHLQRTCEFVQAFVKVCVNGSTVVYIASLSV